MSNRRLNKKNGWKYNSNRIKERRHKYAKAKQKSHQYKSKTFKMMDQHQIYVEILRNYTLRSSHSSPQTGATNGPFYSGMNHIMTFDIKSKEWAWSKFKIWCEDNEHCTDTSIEEFNGHTNNDYNPTNTVNTNFDAENDPEENPDIGAVLLASITQYYKNKTKIKYIESQLDPLNESTEQDQNTIDDRTLKLVSNMMIKFDESKEMKASFDETKRITKYDWTITQQNVNKFKQLPNGSSIKSDNFKSEQNIKWYLEYCLNRNDKYKMFLTMLSVPHKYKSVAVYFYIYCSQTNSCFSRVCHIHQVCYILTQTNSCFSSILRIVRYAYYFRYIS
eukprot:459241_1